MELIVMVAVLATDPIRVGVAAIAVILLRKSGLKSILIAGLVAAVSMELLMLVFGSASGARLIPAFVAGVFHAGGVYGLARLLGWIKAVEAAD